MKQNKHMEKVLVIGGSGFMGSHTADELSRRGFAVTIYDRTASLWLREDQKMVLGDLMDIDALRTAMQGAAFVYHFAGIADIGEARVRPYDTIESNVMGVTKALEVAVECGVRRFVYASTMYVYSNHGSFYRASKQAAEVIIEAYQERFGFDFILLRYGSLYGPRSQEWNGIRRFATQIVKEGRLDYSGNGQEMREYIHVHDAARLSVDVLAPKYANCAITITGQQLIRVDELISILFEIVGNDRVVNYHGENTRPDHYGNTPYRYTPKSAKKIVPLEFVDLGQGLLDVIEEIHHELNPGEH
jgi:UDP-glucose 4-epimerase